jgi:quinolinate synthase
MKNETIKQKISELKKIKNAAILAHHYAPEEVHEIADVLSDSRGFFEAVKGGVDADILIVVAPTFFAEITAAMLPDKTIMVPVHSECPVANHPALSFEKIAEFREKHHDTPFVCYATSPLKTKLLADFICVPGEVVQTIESVDNPKVLFAGERNCAKDALQKTTKQVIEYPLNPVCNVYNSANASDVYYWRQQHPESQVLVHPECKAEVLDAADKVMGTGEMYKHIANSDVDTFILGTEMGFWERVKNEFPDKEIIHLSPFLMCNVFKVFRIETVLDALEDRGTTIRVEQAVANKVAALFNQIPEKFGIAASGAS